MGQWIKTRWKTGLIVLLTILFVSKCCSSNNYERKYKKESRRVEFVSDSLSNICNLREKIIDSLNAEIRILCTRLESSESQSKIYQNQNNRLNDRLKDVAGKQVNVKIENKTADTANKQ